MIKYTVKISDKAQADMEQIYSYIAKEMCIRDRYNRVVLIFSINQFNICGLGGIGRRARLRGVWETVPVQVR